MDKKVINSLEEFINEDKFLEETTIYRGLPDKNYPLIPGIGRYDIVKSRLYQLEKDILMEFKRKLEGRNGHITETKFRKYCRTLNLFYGFR